MAIKGRIVSHHYTDVLVILNFTDFTSLFRHSVLLLFISPLLFVSPEIA